MTEPAPTSLVTTHCVQCDYPLEGLPRDAKCPECGTAIDDRFLVIRGTVVGGVGDSQLRSSVVLGVSVMFSSTVQRLLFGKQLHGWAEAAFFFCWFSVFSPALLVSLWRKWHLEGPPHQLWLCEQGFWTRSRINTFQTWKARWTINTLFIAACVAVIAWLCVRDIWLGIIAGFFGTLAVVAIVMVNVALRRDSRLVDVAGLEQQRCILWQSVGSVVVHHEADGRCLFRFEPRPPTFWDYHRQRRSDFRCTLSLVEAKQLRLQVERLHSRGCRRDEGRTA